MTEHTQWVDGSTSAMEKQWHALEHACGLYDARNRGRLCLVGEDRASFLHGQVTQEVRQLKPGQGTYAALADGKGRFLCDVNIYCLEEELLLDFEGGLMESVRERLERYLISEDVTLVDAAEHVTMLTLQGPLAGHLLESVFEGQTLPDQPGQILALESKQADGEVYMAFRPRGARLGFDLFIPLESISTWSALLSRELHQVGGSVVEETSMELLRIQAGLPRTGTELLPSVLVQESGLADAMISFHKGCYIGQEVISRIKTSGKLNRVLSHFSLDAIPYYREGSPVILFSEDQAVGWLTSVAICPGKTPSVHALGYLRTAALSGESPIYFKDFGDSLVEVRRRDSVSVYHPSLG